MQQSNDRFLTKEERESKLNAAVCLCCGEILISKHTHDYVVCGCDNHSMVDGGPDYRKRGGVDMSKVITVYTLEKANSLRELALELKAAPKWKDVRENTKGNNHSRDDEGTSLCGA